MCFAKPPTPQAPPAPIPERDSKIDSVRARQQASMAANQGGYQSTMLTAPGGDTSSVSTASPVLGK